MTSRPPVFISRCCKLVSDQLLIRCGSPRAASRDSPDCRPAYRGEPFSLRPHQKTALDDVTGGFEAQDRGQLIMACGTGKTFAALRIAEAVAGIGGRVLYLVPSISLFQQSR